MSFQNSVTALLVVAAASHTVLAQGDPEALTGKTLNNPTSSWQQWQPKPTYALEDVPDQYMGANRIPGYSEPQTGFNQCADEGWNQRSQCQTAWLNDVNDWCIWGPPDGGEIGATERIAVAYCTTDTHGTRLIPDGTLKSAHFLKTPSYVQITGLGDFTKIGIPAGDAGGEMDPHGADDLGNPIGGILFTTANPATNGKPWQAREWTNFMSADTFCLRACWGNQAAQHCEHIYDVLGCRWNMPSTSGYLPDIWESCDGDAAPLAGIYDGSTFRQGDAVTPEAHAPAASSNCQATSSLAHGLYAVTSSTSTPEPTSTSASSTATGAIDAASPTSTVIGSDGGSSAATSSSGSNATNGALQTLASSTLLGSIGLALSLALASLIL